MTDEDDEAGWPDVGCSSVRELSPRESSGWLTIWWAPFLVGAHHHLIQSLRRLSGLMEPARAQGASTWSESSGLWVGPWPGCSRCPRKSSLPVLPGGTWGVSRRPRKLIRVSRAYAVRIGPEGL